jgi:hypothetical protein
MNYFVLYITKQSERRSLTLALLTDKEIINNVTSSILGAIYADSLKRQAGSRCENLYRCIHPLLVPGVVVCCRLAWFIYLVVGVWFSLCHFGGAWLLTCSPVSTWANQWNDLPNNYNNTHIITKRVVVVVVGPFRVYCNIYTLYWSTQVFPRRRKRILF